jgi:hypothetical protein
MLVQLIDNLEVVLLEKLVAGKFHWLQLKSRLHYCYQLINQILMTFILLLFSPFNPLILSSIEEIKGWNSVGKQP